MWETTVMFLAGLTVVMLLSSSTMGRRPERRMRTHEETFRRHSLDTAFRLIVPFSLVYGVYVLIFGEAGPGGGFQAGALLSIGVVLSRLIMGDQASFNISIKNSLVLAGVGTFIYAATGWLAMLNGGNFLDYSYLPFKAEHTNELHALGILFIEIGVTICVMMTILNILDAVVERGDENGSAK